MQINGSIETIAKDKQHNPIICPVDLDDLVKGTADTSFAHDHDYSMAATGVCFSREKQGVIPKLCEQFYADRKQTKRKFLSIKNEHEKIVEELRRRGINV